MPLLFAKYSSAEKRQQDSGRCFGLCPASTAVEEVDFYQTKRLDRRGDEKNSAQPCFPVPVNFPSPLIKGTLQLPQKGFCPLFAQFSEGPIRSKK